MSDSELPSNGDVEGSGNGEVLDPKVQVIDTLRRIAQDPEVTGWFDKGGKRIVFLDEERTVGWDGQDIQRLIITQAEAAGDTTSKPLLLEIHGGGLGNKKVTDSGLYEWVEDEWKGKDVNLPDLQNNRVLKRMVDLKEITSESIMLTANEKVKVVPIEALGEQDKNRLQLLIDQANNDADLAEDVAFSLRSDNRDKLPNNFVDRLGKYSTFKSQMEVVKDRVEDYIREFDGRDDEVGFRNFGIGFPRVVDSAEAQLSEYSDVLAVEVGNKLVGGVDAIMADPELSKAGSVEEIKARLAEMVQQAEEKKGVEVDIATEENQLLKLGKALGYEDLLIHVDELKQKHYADYFKEWHDGKEVLTLGEFNDSLATQLESRKNSNATRASVGDAKSGRGGYGRAIRTFFNRLFS
jgi:hypothetical protein